jgi:CRP-like cAMP-binding protein
VGDAVEFAEETRKRARTMADLTDRSGARLERLAAAAAHPLAELLDCPADAGNLLSDAMRTLDFESGQMVFRQDAATKGLYVVVSGEFARKAERLGVRMSLGTARPGDLVELAAALCGGRHTYTLSAVTAGSALLLPIEALERAFRSYPPLRMRLLEELAREVSRAYISCAMSRIVPARRRGQALQSA